MNTQLIDTLRGVDKPYHVWHAPDGTALLILGYGGRILGLYAAGSDENFFWTHPALASVDSAAEFYASDQWHNSGGERTWLAPEVDIFFPEYPRTDKYWQPRQLDPGDWRLSVAGDSVQWVNRLVCRLSRSGVDVDVTITKTVTPASNPLQHERDAIWPVTVQYGGYTVSTRLELTADESQPRGPVGLWNLIQLPHEGDFIVPTYYASPPRVLFGEVRGTDIEVQPRVVRYAMRAQGEHKIAFRATAVTGRVGYRYQAADGHAALVVRNVFVNPSGPYVDVPWSDTEDLGYAVQACNIHSSLGRFSELEYHVPAVGTGTGRTACEDISQTWAYRGSRDAIARIMERLLTPVEGDSV